MHKRFIGKYKLKKSDRAHGIGQRKTIGTTTSEKKESKIVLVLQMSKLNLNQVHDIKKKTIQDWKNPKNIIYIKITKDYDEKENSLTGMKLKQEKQQKNVCTRD